MFDVRNTHTHNIYNIYTDRQIAKHSAVYSAVQQLRTRAFVLLLMMMMMMKTVETTGKQLYSVHCAEGE